MTDRHLGDVIHRHQQGRALRWLMLHQQHNQPVMLLHQLDSKELLAYQP